MNLWRAPIEERTGRVGGPPEPVTSSSQASMLLSISHDGRRIAYASDNSRTLLEQAGWDPARTATVSAPSTILQTSRVIVACDVSRDGRWIVFGTSTPHEDFFLVRPDGSGLRQLTRDGFRNREPRWSPDGSRVAFYSNRGGRYDLWAIGADGSRLELLAAVPGGRVAHPVWSPDGRRIACDVEEGEALVDLVSPLGERRPRLIPPAGPGASFSASSWSPDGKRLAGVLHQPDGPRAPGIVLYSLDGGTYDRLTARGTDPHWLSDSRRLIYRDGEKVFVLDTRTRASRQVMAAPPGSDYSDLVPAANDRALYFARKVDQGDIWLLTSR